MHSLICFRWRNSGSEAKEEHVRLKKREAEKRPIVTEKEGEVDEEAEDEDFDECWEDESIDHHNKRNTDSAETIERLSPSVYYGPIMPTGNIAASLKHSSTPVLLKCISNTPTMLPYQQSAKK
ncbi:hypothetical protein GMOD_00003769 [Pyrenophora seminiperda CCB06]|uniref:Uncharacterized protein n=1 Tax=Pyrenophora seminiperda CCB06 TaxID=1302712 RepID=A0A3M7MJG5_9PLEO|nr:hypothetical protein GMOD_00003769 [Pyrenophora seminiperda CCB06]